MVLEDRDEAYVVQRVRAGVLEQGTMDTLRAAGVGERMDRQGALHEGIELRYDGQATGSTSDSWSTGRSWSTASRRSSRT